MLSTSVPSRSKIAAEMAKVPSRRTQGLTHEKEGQKASL
jgi:hypothetical protein